MAEAKTETLKADRKHKITVALTPSSTQALVCRVHDPPSESGSCARSPIPAPRAVSNGLLLDAMTSAHWCIAGDSLAPGRHPGRDPGIPKEQGLAARPAQVVWVVFARTRGSSSAWQIGGPADATAPGTAPAPPR